MVSKSCPEYMSATNKPIFRIMKNIIIPLDLKCIMACYFLMWAAWGRLRAQGAHILSSIYLWDCWDNLGDSKTIWNPFRSRYILAWLSSPYGPGASKGGSYLKRRLMGPKSCLASNVVTDKAYFVQGSTWNMSRISATPVISASVFKHTQCLFFTAIDLPKCQLGCP